MNNTFSMTDAAAVFLDLYRKDGGLISRTYRDADAEFGGGVGDTVNLRRYATKANTAGLDNSAELTVSDIHESSVPVTLTANVHVRNLLTNLDHLDLADFAKQVQGPAASAVTGRINAMVAAVLNGATASSTISYTESDPLAAVIAARTALRTAGVPEDAGIYAECSPVAFGALLAANAFSDAEASRIKGVQFFESNRITGDAIVVHTKDAVGVALRAPNVSAAPDSASVRSDEGFAISVARAYSPSHAKEDVLHSVLAGAVALPLLVEDEATGTITATPGGNVVRILPAA